MTDYQRGQKLLRGDYSCYTPTGKSYFVQHKKYSTTPHVGDIVYFYTSNLGRVSHVGIVSAVEFSDGLYTIQTIEGNTNAGILFERDGGCVAIKKYEFYPSQVGNKNRIDGFGTPDFGAETCSAEQLVLMAMSQRGYVEKASDKDLETFGGSNVGNKNYTKYNSWAVASGWGYQPAQWCQTFVSWCAYQACLKAREVPEPAAWLQQDDGSWNYRKETGQLARDEWLYIGGRWYVFDGSGRMIKGWFKVGVDDWYYLGEDGAMLSGQWVTRDDKSYYLTKTGLMARNAYVKSDKPFAPGRYIFYWVDENGVWMPQWDTEKPHLETYELAV